MQIGIYNYILAYKIVYKYIIKYWTIVNSLTDCQLKKLDVLINKGINGSYQKSLDLISVKKIHITKRGLCLSSLLIIKTLLMIIVNNR